MKHLLKPDQVFFFAEYSPGLTFRVTRCEMTGGGCAHGPHDSYPAGHRVTAEPSSGGPAIEFYQSGCFTDMREPEAIVLIDGPLDAEGKWLKVYQ